MDKEITKQVEILEQAQQLRLEGQMWPIWPVNLARQTSPNYIIKL